MAVYRKKHFSCYTCNVGFNIWASDDEVAEIQTIKCGGCDSNWTHTEVVELDSFKMMWELKGEPSPDIGNCNISSGINMASKVPQGFKEVLRQIKKNNPGHKIDGAL